MALRHALDPYHVLLVEKMIKQLEVRATREVEKAKARELAALRADESGRMAAIKEAALRQATSDFSKEMAVEKASRAAVEKELVAAQAAAAAGDKALCKLSDVTSQLVRLRAQVGQSVSQ